MDEDDEEEDGEDESKLDDSLEDRVARATHTSRGRTRPPLFDESDNDF